MYFLIRSPGTGGFDANYAWNVDRSGNIPLFTDHGNSYGFTRSPGTGSSYVAYLIYLSGDVSYDFGGNVYISYGMYTYPLSGHRYCS